MGLDNRCDIVLLGLVRVLRVEQRPGPADKELRLAHAVLLIVPAQVLDQLLDSRLRTARTLVVRPGGLAQRLVALQEELVGAAVGEAGPPHPQVLHESQVLDLMQHQLVVEDARSLQVVGLDAANVAGLLAHQDVHEVVQRGAELGDGRVGALQAAQLLLREAAPHNAVARLAERLLQVPEEQIVVLVQEPVDAVGDLAGVVNQAELVAQHDLLDVGRRLLVADVVMVLRQLVRELLEEGDVRGLARPQALLVQNGDDALVLLLDQIADHLVVEVLHRDPLDALPAVLVLLGLQRQLDEQLLQLLVAEVDAELLEAVLLEDLEAVDVQDAHHVALGAPGLLRLQRDVQALHQPREQPVVDGLGQGIPGIDGQFMVQRRGHHITASIDGAMGEGGLQFARIHAQEPGSGHHQVAAVDLGIALHLAEGDIAQMQDAGHNAEDLALLLLGEIDHGEGLLHLPEVVRIVDARHAALELGIEAIKMKVNKESSRESSV